MSGVLERLTTAQNSHDAAAFAAMFSEDYRSSQPAHPERAFVGNQQVLENWTAVFAGVPDFHAELVASCLGRDAQGSEVEWGEVDWRGHHVDGAPFAMRGVIIATVHDDRIAAARLFMEPVERGGGDIDSAVDELYHPPRER